MSAENPDKGRTITIDSKPYRVGRDKLTGTQIRLMAQLPDTFDLYVVDEMADYDGSREVGWNELVRLREGLRFFSADPKDI